VEPWSLKNDRIDQFDAGAAAFAALRLATCGRAERDLPKDPLNIFPFLVFLSPLPMMVGFC
jgi:hypothetical protein